LRISCLPAGSAPRTRMFRSFSTNLHLLTLIQTVGMIYHGVGSVGFMPVCGFDVKNWKDG
jgi:hypothetical protein